MRIKAVKKLSFYGRLFSGKGIFPDKNKTILFLLGSEQVLVTISKVCCEKIENC